MNESSAPDSKVLFRIPTEGGEVRVETLWATSLGNDKYRLENSPFYAYSVSWEDVVIAPYDSDEGFPVFSQISSKSGRRTIRVVFDRPVQEGNDADEILQGLVRIGCSYEGANRRYIAVDVPPEVQLDEVCNYLIAKGVQWEHADPTHDELYQK